MSLFHENLALSSQHVAQSSREIDQSQLAFMNPVLEEILRTGNTISAAGEEIKVHSQIPEDQGESPQKMILELRPKVTLEIGLGFGVSSLYICEALAEVEADRHIIIDPFQHHAWKGADEG